MQPVIFKLNNIYEKCIGHRLYRSNRLRAYPENLGKRYGNDSIVAGYIKGAEPKGELKESGPSAEADVTNPEMIADVVKKYNIDTILQPCSITLCSCRKEASISLENRY